MTWQMFTEYDLDHQTRQLLALIDVLGLQKPVLVGHSSGAAWVVEAAVQAQLQQATSLLGIAPGDVYRAQLDGNRTPGGTRVTVDETEAVIAAFAERFPQATFATMSWLAERHPDHLNVGRALSAAAVDGRVAYAEFAVSRLWWALPSPACADVLPTSAAVRRRVAAAAEAYERWDPAHQRYAVGWLSVHAQFTELIADPHTRLHGADAGAGADPVRTRDRRSAR